MSEIDTLLDAPCAICGYSGPLYWQRESHSRDCPWHYVGGAVERERALRALLPRLSADAKEAQIGEYVADYTMPTQAEIHAPDPASDGLFKNSRAVSDAKSQKDCCLDLPPEECAKVPTRHCLADDSDSQSQDKPK